MQECSGRVLALNREPTIAFNHRDAHPNHIGDLLRVGTRSAQPDAGMGTQSGTLGTCGTGSAPYVTEAQGTLSARTGRLQTIDQPASTSTPLMAHTVDSFTVNAVTGEGTYAGTYHCT